MAYWTSSAWTTTSWVSVSWRGDISAAPQGNWIGDNWLRPGWTLSSWTTNEGDAPTSLFLSDSLDVAFSAETPASPQIVRLARADTLSISLIETFSLTYKRHVVAFETLQIGLGELQLSVRRNTLADALAVSFTETASNAQGDLILKTADDDLDVVIDDPGVNQFLEAVDTLGAGITESSSYLVSLLRADSLSLLLGEVYSKTFTGALAVSASDLLSVSFTEVTTPHIFYQLERSDSLDLTFAEEAIRVEGIVTVYLQQFDTLELTTDEGLATVVDNDTVGLTAEDGLNILLTEQATKVALVFFTAGDTLNLAVVDSTLLSKISVDVGWEDADYPWGGGSLRDIKPLPVFAQGFDFYVVDSGDTFVDNKPIAVLLERLGLTIYGRDRQGNWKEDPDVSKLVKGLYPLIRGETGTIIHISVGAQDSLEEGVVWDGPHEFVLGRDTYVTPLIEGRYIAVRFESSGQKPWTLLSYDLDITKVGRGSF
jgi:hypothetical protein